MADSAPIDANTAMFGLNDFIYVMKRTLVRTMKLALILIGIVAFGVAAQAAETSCTAEIGAAKASVLVGQCTDISPATHPPCNAANPCELIRSEIQRGCDFARSTSESGPPPDYCKQYPAQPSGY